MAVDAVRSLTPARPAVAAKAQGPEKAPVAGPTTQDTFVKSGTSVAGAAFMGVATFALVGARSGPVGWALLALNTALGAIGGMKLGEWTAKLFNGEGLKANGLTVGGVVGGLALGGSYGFFALLSAGFKAINPVVAVGVGVVGLLAGAKIGNWIQDGVTALIKK